MHRTKLVVLTIYPFDGFTQISKQRAPFLFLLEKKCFIQFSTQKICYDFGSVMHLLSWMKGKIFVFYFSFIRCIFKFVNFCESVIIFLLRTSFYLACGGYWCSYNDRTKTKGDLGWEGGGRHSCLFVRYCNNKNYCNNLNVFRLFSSSVGHVSSSWIL